MKFKTILCIILSLLILSCSQRKSKKISLNVSNNLSFLSQIENPGVIRSHKDRIFIEDKSTKEILVYNTRGNKIGEFCKQGQGPGEVSGIMKIAVDSERIFVFDKNNQKVQIFGNNNKYNFLKNVKISFGMVVKAECTADKIIIQALRPTPEKNKVYMKTNLFICNQDLEILHEKELSSLEIKRNTRFNPKLLVHSMTISDSKIYIAYASYTNYKIEAYSFDGKMLFDFVKPYIKKELKAENKILEANKRQFTTEEYDLAVRNVYPYKEGILLEVPDQKNSAKSFFILTKKEFNKEYLRSSIPIVKKLIASDNKLLLVDNENLDYSLVEVIID